MAFKTVTCEVRWIASVGYGGNELLPTNWEAIGEFEDKGDAERALAEAGLTRQKWGHWSGHCAHGSIARVLRETEYQIVGDELRRAIAEKEEK